MDLDEIRDMGLKGLESDNTQGSVIGSLTVTGRIVFYNNSSKRCEMMVVHCSECALDPQLHRQGYYIIDKNHLKNGVKPCGCAKLPRWKEWQYEVLAQRAAEKVKLWFVGWAEPYKKAYTRCLLECPIHGQYSTASLNGLINNKRGCPRCWYDNAPLLQPKPDETMIESFLASGSFSSETIFYRSERKTSKGKRIYWFVECPDCGSLGESLSSDLQAGKRPCTCSIKSPKYSYLLLLSDGDVKLALKLGITSNYTRRLKDLSNRSKYSVYIIGIWEYITPSECRKAELECLRNLDCGILTKEVLSNGYTETTSINNLDEIVRIYEENGGIRLTVD